MLYTFENINMNVYGLMWGPNEYVLFETVRLHDWDTRNWLNEIETETLVLSGHCDEISPDIVHDVTEQISHAEMVVFDESSHMPFWEQPDEHYEVVEGFLLT